MLVLVTQGALRTLLGDPRSAPLLAQHLGVEAWMTLRVASRCTGGRVFDNNDTWRTLLPGLAPHEVSECVHRVKVMCSITPHPPQVACPHQASPPSPTATAPAEPALNCLPGWAVASNL